MASRTLVSSFRTCFITDSKPMLTYCRIFEWQTRRASGASKKPAKAGASKKKQFEVETDTKILSTRLCGGNIYKEGEDPVLGPDSDYPDWLWNLRTDKKPIPIEELSPEDPMYWRKLKTSTMKRNNILKSLKPRK